MNLLLHVSDTHFGTERVEAVKALERLAREQKPGIVVLSGDITQRARGAQFDAAREFVARVNAPVTLAVPGNHDIPLFNVFARLLCPYARYMRAFGRDLEPKYESDELLILCLNTTRARRHIDGEISVEQTERTATRLRAARREQLRIVVLHHPVHVIRPEDEQNVLHGHLQALRAWAQSGADLVLGGHIHLPYVRPVKGLARTIWAVQAGTAVSSRVRDGAPNSVNILRYNPCAEPLACAVERWDFGARSFDLAKVTHVPLDR